MTRRRAARLQLHARACVRQLETRCDDDAVERRCCMLATLALGRCAGVNTSTYSDGAVWSIRHRGSVVHFVLNKDRQ